MVFYMERLLPEMLKRSFRRSPAALLRCATALACLCSISIISARAQWVQTNFPTGANNYLAFASIGSNVFVGGINIDVVNSRFVWLTTDNGVSWTNTNFPPGTSELAVFGLFASGSNLFAGSYQPAVSLSTDSGKTWQPSSNGLPADCAVKSFGAIGTILFAGTSSGTQAYGIYRSTDSGKSWNPVNNGLTGNWTGNTCFSLVSIGTNLFASMEQVTFLYGDTDRVYRSTDSGGSWVEINTGIDSSTVAGYMTVVGTNLFAATGQGVYRSADSGASWFAVNNGIDYPDEMKGGFAVNCETLFFGNP